MTRARDLAKGTFSGDLTVDTNTLVVDSANNRVGVGTSSPGLSNTEGVSFIPGTATYVSLTGSNGSSNLFLGNNGNGSNLATNSTLGAIAFKGRFNGTFGGANDVASIVGTYTGDGTTRSGAIRFITINNGSESERMRIDSSGKLLVGLSSSSNLFAVSSNGIKNDLYVTTGGNVGAYSLGTGTVTCSSGIISFSSDERLKIADGVLSGGIDKVMQIVPQYFYWRDENGDKDQQRPRELGFFAQNIQTICGQEVAPDPHREDLFLGIHDRGVMAVLVKAIQEQQATITAQQTTIDAMETRLAALEAN